MILRTLVATTTLFGLLALSTAAFAETTVTNAWVRATVGSGNVSAGYGVMKNTGTFDDELISVSTPAATMTEVHQSKHDDGIMKMEPVHNLSIPAGKSIELNPGGYHLMIMNITRPLKEGETIDLTFTFKKQGPVKVVAKVANIATEHMH